MSRTTADLRLRYTGFALGFVPAAALTPFQIFVGDTAVRAIAQDQPVKSASMEYVARTSRNVPEWLGGVYTNGHIYAGLKIPYMDSLLAGFGPGTQVSGWDSVPPADRPPVMWLIHLCFDVMVGLGFLLLTSAGTPHATLVAIIWLSAAAVLIVGPSYALLFFLQGRQVVQAGDEGTDFLARPGRAP